MSSEQQAVYKRILNGASFEERAQQMYGMSRRPFRGEFLIAGPCNAGLAHRIGYVVQIRVKQGVFGSDIYLLRHSDGVLMQHANNLYLPMTEEEVDLVRPFYGDDRPDSECYEEGFTLGSRESLAVGFVIEPPADFQVRGGGGARMRVTVKDADGNSSVTDTVFL